MTRIVPDWFTRLTTRLGVEHRLITRAWTELPYLSRWLLVNRMSEPPHPRDFGVYLHEFHRSDADEMHDHPWPFVSLILSGGYWEVTPDYAGGWKDGVGPTKRKWYGPGRLLRRPADWVHSVQLPRDGAGREVPALTLIVRGAKARRWGFHCPHRGWVHWKVHLARSKVNRGNGCG